jgi:predicted dehydrogenase
MAKDKLRFGVVALGYISQVAMLPAFEGARRACSVGALISGSREKLRAIADAYEVETIGNYRDLEKIAASGVIDAVYIALPNTMHRAMTLRALDAGLHVLCEKPLAMTAADCKAMVDLARRRKLQLMTAYRLQFEPGYLAAMTALHDGSVGKLRYFASQFSMQVKPGNIRTRSELGGGPLYDLGIYCVNAARHVFMAEPIEVSAQMAGGRDRRSREVEEMAQVLLRFPDDRFASFTCSFGAADASSFQVWGTEGHVKLEQAYEMVGEKTLVVERSGGGGKPRTTRRTFAGVDQFAPLALEFAEAVAEGRDVYPDGAEGMADIRVLEAITAAAKSGKTQRLRAVDFAGQRLDAKRARKVPAHDKPELVKAESPSQ